MIEHPIPLDEIAPDLAAAFVEARQRVASFDISVAPCDDDQPHPNRKATP